MKKYLKKEKRKKGGGTNFNSFCNNNYTNPKQSKHHTTNTSTTVEGTRLLFPTLHLLLLELVSLWFISLLQPVKAQGTATPDLFTEDVWLKKNSTGGCRLRRKSAGSRQLSSWPLHRPQVTRAYSIWRSVLIRLCHKTKKHYRQKTGGKQLHQLNHVRQVHCDKMLMRWWLS